MTFNLHKIYNFGNTLPRLIVWGEEMNKNEYKSYVEKRAKKSPVLKNCSLAFLIGGLICVIAQGFSDLYKYLGLNQKLSSTLASVTIIFFASLLTCLGVFDNIAKHAGTGTSLPISGFANSITSQAIDSKSEGLILGVGAKIFTIAGHVILFGISSGVIYGIILYIYTLVGG